jgi:hypothetical protein
LGELKILNLFVSPAVLVEEQIILMVVVDGLVEAVVPEDF